MKPPRIRTGKAKPQPARKPPSKPRAPKPTRAQIAAGNRMAMVGVK